MARTARHESGCRCSVTLQEVAATLGVPPGQEQHLARHYRVEVGEDWAGRPALSTEQAAEFAATWRTQRDAERGKNEAYQRYLAKCASDAQAAELEARRKAREESQSRWRKASDEDREARTRQAEEKAAERARERARHQGNPVSFEEFEG